MCENSLFFCFWFDVVSCMHKVLLSDEVLMVWCSIFSCQHQFPFWFEILKLYQDAGFKYINSFYLSPSSSSSVQSTISKLRPIGILEPYLLLWSPLFNLVFIILSNALEGFIRLLLFWFLFRISYCLMGWKHEFMKFSCFQQVKMTMIYPALLLSYWVGEKWAI